MDIQKVFIYLMCPERTKRQINGADQCKARSGFNAIKIFLTFKTFIKIMKDTVLGNTYLPPWANIIRSYWTYLEGGTE